MGEEWNGVGENDFASPMHDLRKILHPMFKNEANNPRSKAFRICRKDLLKMFHVLVFLE